MFVNCKCPHCQAIGYHSISFEVEELIFSNRDKLREYVMKNISVNESVTREVLVSDIMRILGSHKEKMGLEELLNVLQNNFGIAGNFCLDLAKEIKEPISI